MAIVKGETKTGYKFEYDDKILHDWELVKLLAKADEEDVSASVKLFYFILGDEGVKKLEEHCSKGGKNRVTIERMRNEMLDIIQYNQEAKNSQA